MSGGFQAKISHLFKTLIGAAKGLETYSSNAYSSTKGQDICTESRLTWIEATPAHASYGNDSYLLAKYTKSQFTISAGVPTILTTFNKELLRNEDGSPSIKSKKEALKTIENFENQMETLCDRPILEGHAVFQRTAPPLTEVSAPAISLF